MNHLSYLDERSKKEFPELTKDLEKRFGDRVCTTPYAKDHDTESCSIFIDEVWSGTLGIIYRSDKPLHKIASLSWDILPPELQQGISDKAIVLQYNIRSNKRTDKHQEIGFP